MNRMIGWFGSLADIEGVEAIPGFGVDPESINGIDVGDGVNWGTADGAPGNALTVNQTVADVLSLVVIAGAGISSLVLVNNTVNQALGICSNSGALLSLINEGIVGGDIGGEELEEEVGPISIDSVDAGERANQVFVGDPDEPAEPHVIGMDGDKEVLSGGAELVVHLFLDVFGIGLEVGFIEWAGGVGIIGEISNVSGGDSGAAEVVEPEDALGGGDLDELFLLDGDSEGGCCDCQD